MKNLRAPLGGDQAHDEQLVTGYAALAKFLSSRGFPISKSSPQKFGMPSAGGIGPPSEGYWGNLPAFRQDRALDWARSRIRRTRGKPAATPAPIADAPPF